MEPILKGTTSKIIEVMLYATTGAGKTGLSHSDITASYIREGSTRTSITPASGTVGDAYSSGKFAEVDSTNSKGLYQLHIPDAALATGADAVTITIQATDVVDTTVRIPLVEVDLQNAASAGLGNLNATISSRMATFTLPPNFSVFSINSSGYVSRVVLCDTTTTNTDMRGTDGAAGAGDEMNLVDGGITAAKIDTDAIGSAQLSTAAVAKIEAALLNEGDGQQLIDAIVQGIDAADIDTTLISTLTRDAVLNRSLAGNHDTVGTVGAFLQRLDALITSRMASFTLPTNFSVLGINSSGHLSRVTLTDTTTDLTNGGGGGGANAEEIADAVWDEPTNAHTGAGTFGANLDAKVSDATGSGGSFSYSDTVQYLGTLIDGATVYYTAPSGTTPISSTTTNSLGVYELFSDTAGPFDVHVIANGYEKFVESNVSFTAV